MISYKEKLKLERIKVTNLEMEKYLAEKVAKNFKKYLKRERSKNNGAIRTSRNEEAKKVEDKWK